MTMKNEFRSRLAGGFQEEGVIFGEWSEELFGYNDKELIILKGLRILVGVSLAIIVFLNLETAMWLDPNLGSKINMAGN